ncbi:sulfate ABC transporter permease subunit [Myxococcota bacterium]|nr:sulfate ABC transporter permease subunit [Myxococcota bacterium]
MAERILRKPAGASRLVFALVCGWLTLLLVVPLLALVGAVVQDRSEVLRTLLSAEARNALLLTLGVALACIACNGVFGVAGALVLVRQRFWLRRVLDALIDMPLALSPVMTGLAFLLVFGRSGVLRPVLDGLGVEIAFAWPSVLLATLFVTLPFTLREVALVLEEVGDSEEQAAATLGASPWQTFWRITLPNLRGGLIIGTTLTTARALGEFGAVLVVGGSIANRTQTATTFIHAAIEERQEPAAFGMALILAAAAILLLLFMQGLDPTQKRSPAHGD